MTVNGRVQPDWHSAAVAAGKECLQAALDYERRGWSVSVVCDPHHVGMKAFSKHIEKCKSPGKAPVHKWKKPETDRLTSADIQRLFARHPLLNVGMFCGPASGLVGIDVDGTGGEQKLQIASGGDLPETLEFDTPSGGRRLLYAIPEGVQVRTTHRNDGDHQGLSYLGKGGHTVMPPSRGKNGGRYRWKPGHGPGEIERAPMPAWLIEALRPDASMSEKRGTVRRQRPDSDRPADADLVLEKCRFLAHCRDDAEHLSEPEWYAMVSNMARTSGGAELVHELSESYPGYDATETDEKIGHALETSGPHTCQYIADQLSSRHCEGCAFRGKITTPLQLGRSGKRTHHVGEVELVPDQPRQTATKVILPVEVRIGGRAVDTVQLSTADSSRRAAAKAIVEHAGDQHTHQAKQAIAAILVEARQKVKSAKPQGTTIRDVLKRHVPSKVNLQYVTEKGRAYSEALGKEISRSQFVERSCNNAILDLAAGAGDAPRLGDGLLNRPALISTVEKELKVLWGDLIEKLPVGSHEPFEDAVLRLWKRPKGMGIVKQHVKTPRGEEAVQLMSSTSLAARAQEIFATWSTGELIGRWVQIQRGYEAYLRLAPMPDGSYRKLLAMRYELADQVGVPLPGVTSQKRLNSIGEQFGVIDPTPPVPNKTADGTKWLAVLMHHITDQILYVPEDDPPNADESHG